MNNISHWVEQETWDFVRGKGRLAFRKVLMESFNTQGFQAYIHPVTEACLDI